jgi:hypothetical protein
VVLAVANERELAFDASADITERTTMASPAPFYDHVGAGVAGSVMAARQAAMGTTVAVPRGRGAGGSSTCGQNHRAS